MSVKIIKQKDKLGEFAKQHKWSDIDLERTRWIIATGDKYNKLPIGPEEFAISRDYGNALNPDGSPTIWPKVMDYYVEMNTGEYDECLMTGSIGCAKTTLALYGLLYQLYLVSCYKDPHSLFNLDPASEILIVFQSLNASTAESVDYARFKSMVDRSPYFEKIFPYDHSIKSELRFPNRVIVKPTASNIAGAIGQNLIAGALDECFVAGTKISTVGGTIPIERISIGDLVISVGEGGVQEAVIEGAFLVGMRCIFEVEFDDGSALVGTQAHPLATPLGWVDLIDSIGRDIYATTENTNSFSIMESKAKNKTPQDYGPSRRDGKESGNYNCKKFCSGETISQAYAPRQYREGRIRTEVFCKNESNVSCYEFNPRDEDKTWRTESEKKFSSSNAYPRNTSQSYSEQNRWEKIRGNKKEDVGIESELVSGVWWECSQGAYSIYQTKHQKEVCTFNFRSEIDRDIGSILPSSIIRVRNSKSALWDKNNHSGFFNHNGIREESAGGGESILCCDQVSVEDTGSKEICPSKWVGFSGLDRKRVVAVRFKGYAPVYNLTVSGTHTYFANGVAVHNCNFMGVVEKSRRSMDGAYDQAKELYDAIDRRRKSRFMVKGHLPGILFLSSSKRYPGEFTDRKMEEARKEIQETGHSTIYVYDKRSWDVRPDSAYSGVKFRVFVGDLTRRPRILDDKEKLSESDSTLVTEVPEEYKSSFEQDIIGSIRDIAGISTTSRFPYMIEVEKVSACFGKTKSILTLDEVDFLTQKVSFNPKTFYKPEIPRAMHIDLGLTSDAAGVSCAYVPEFIKIKRGMNLIETMPKIVFDFVLRVVPPKNGEILFFKIRELIYKLREHGLNIKWISYDMFQGIDSMQMLRQRGFATGYTSMDRTSVPYDFAKSAFYDGRVLAPNHDLAKRELLALEKDPKTGKVDHPIHFGKDCADSMSGTIFLLTVRREVWAYHSIPVQDIPESIVEAVKKNTDKMKEAVPDKYANMEQIDQ